MNAGEEKLKEFRPREWPTLPLPRTRMEWDGLAGRLGGADKLAEFLRRREELIDLEVSDPLRHGYEMESWRRVRELLKTKDEVLALGGNGSGKSWFAARLGVRALVEHENWNVAFFHTTNESSINQQQEIVWRTLPPEWRSLGKVSSLVNVSYTRQNGFSNGRFTLPNGSRGLFFNVSQDVRVVAGYKFELVLVDEWMPDEFFDEIEMRLPERHGKIVITYTPVEGYTPVVKRFLEGATVVETQPARFMPQNARAVAGCPRGHMPYVLECFRKDRAVVCFASEGNPYNSVEELTKRCAGQTSAWVKLRMYGWPERARGVAFPKFGKANIVRDDQAPGELTRYCVADPGGSKNWFIVWLGVDRSGEVWAYREWPDERMGEWALPSERPDGKPGPAQRAEAGRGIRAYRELILELERGEDIYERLMDPRAGAAYQAAAEEGTSIIGLMAEGHPGAKAVADRTMIWQAAPASRVEEGVDLLQAWFDYDSEAPLSGLNHPRFRVTESCRNLIYALSTWTGADGEKGATKDPIDCLRYAVKRGLIWDDPGAARSWGGGSY